MGLTRRGFLAGSSSLALGFGKAAARPLLSKPFSRADIEERARQLAAKPHEPPGRHLPKAVAELDWDGWREIRFKPSETLLDSASRFRLQAFHLGHLFKRPVRLNRVAGDMADPIGYTPAVFDFGGHVFDPPLPRDLGYAGWRINYPLNKPDAMDELISFLGSSYFRVLGRGQVYGLSARGLSIGSGLLDIIEEFPFFREFWFERPVEGARNEDDAITFYALLDSPSLTGAYEFVLRPGEISTIDVVATLYARRRLDQLVGIAPLTSMFFIGENDRHYNDRNRYDDYRPEMHDSDGLRFHLEDGSWGWRPLRNPQVQEVSYFPARNIRGFGLMQRDRTFANYQDIDLAYQLRPSYWIEPKGDWGEGRLELIELATRDETADNIVLAWLPAKPIEPERPVTFAYRLSSGLDFSSRAQLGRVAHTFAAPVGALGSRETRHPGSRRFLVDFEGGDLYEPENAKVDVKVVGGQALRCFTAPNPHVKGIRAFIDVKGIPSETLFVTARLVGPSGRALTESWHYRWKAE
jgi:glucans biosynthesis protein